jgi:hypothetical protein
MWRFKTEEEFKEEFGDSWRKKITNSWNSSGKMDYLLGERIDPGKLTPSGFPDMNGGTNCTVDNFGIGTKGMDTEWYITMDMLKFDKTLEKIYEIY